MDYMCMKYLVETVIAILENICFVKPIIINIIVIKKLNQDLEFST